MGDHHQGDPGAAQRVQSTAHGVAARAVEPGERLVEHEEAGLGREEPGEDDPALFAAAEFVDRAVGEPLRVEADGGESGVGGRRVGVRRIAHVLADGGPQQGEPGVLDAQQCAVAPVVQRPSVEGDAPPGGHEQTGEHPRQRGLARSVGPRDQHRVPGWDVEVDTAQGRVLPRRSRVVDEQGVPHLDAGSPHPRHRPPRGRRGRGLLVGVEVQGVGGGQLVRVVGDVHDGGAVLAHQAVQEFDDVGPAAGIEHRGALVADHHGGPAGDEGGDGEALELAAGQRGRLTLGETGESDPGEQPVDVDVGPRVRPPQQVVDDADAEDLALRALEDHPRAAGCPEARRPGPVDGALGRRLTGQDPPERRLPGPVRAAHTEEPPSFQRQVDPGEGRPRRPLVADADPGEPDGQGRDDRAPGGGLVELPGRRPRQQGRDAAQRRAQGEGRADHPDEHRHGHHRGQQDPPPRHGERDDGASDVESGAGHARGGGEPLGPGPGVGELGQRQRAGVGQHPEQAHREHGVRHAEAHQPDARGPADGPAPAQADPDQRAENARADGGGGGSQPAAEEGDAARGQHRDRADPRSTAVTDDGEGEGRQQDTDPARRHQPREHGDGRDQVSQGRCLGDLRHRERPSAAPVRPRQRHPGHMAHHRPGGLRPAQGSPTADGQVYDARADREHLDPHADAIVWPAPRRTVTALDGCAPRSTFGARVSSLSPACGRAGWRTATRGRAIGARRSARARPTRRRAARRRTSPRTRR